MEYVLLMVHCWSALKNIDYFIFLFSYKSVDIFAVELQNRPRMYLPVSRCHTHAHLFILFYWLVLHQIMSNCNGISSLRAKWMWQLIYEIMNITSIFIFFTKYFITVYFLDVFSKWSFGCLYYRDTCLDWISLCSDSWNNQLLLWQRLADWKAATGQRVRTRNMKTGGQGGSGVRRAELDGWEERKHGSEEEENNGRERKI